MIRYELIQNAFRKIFCQCHKCDQIFRLSEIEINSGEREKSDCFAKLDKRIERLQDQIEKAEELFEAKRYTIIEKERRSVERETSRKLNKLIPNFSKLNLNTRDVKTIGFPVKFISFDGKSYGWIKKLRFIDFEPESKIQEKIHNSLRKTIKAGNIEWKTLRITDEGKIQEE